MENTLKETAENLQLYFQLGDMKSFKKMDALLIDNFKEKEEFTQDVNNEIDLMSKEKVRIDFVHIANRLYNKNNTPKDFESGVSRCENIILKMFELKN